MTFQKPGRFYDTEGRIQHDAGLRIAKKEKLLVSVTTVLKQQQRAPMLEQWKMDQLFEAVATMPRKPEWTDDYYRQLCQEEQERRANDTARWGTGFHALVEAHCRGQAASPNETYLPFFTFYTIWHHENVRSVRSVEEVVVSRALGYAGRTDLRLLINGKEGSCLGDIKTRDVREGTRPTYYMEQSMQLAAYRMCYPVGDRPVHFFSLLINRLRPEPPYVKWWSEKEMALADWRWSACLEHYRADNNWKWTP